MSPSTRNRLLGTGGLLGLGLAALVAFRGCSGADQPGGQRANTPATAASTALPQFASAEQRRAYYESVQQGEKSSLKLIDDALAQARAAGSADPAYVAKLERLRVERAARLEAYQTHAK
jgi:hypothetical protein